MQAVVVTAAMERAGPALGHNADLARRPPVLCLVRAREETVFLHRVETDRRELIPVVAGIHVADAVHVSWFWFERVPFAEIAPRPAVPATWKCPVLTTPGVSAAKAR